MQLSKLDGFWRHLQVFTWHQVGTRKLAFNRMNHSHFTLFLANADKPTCQLDTILSFHSATLGRSIFFGAAQGPPLSAICLASINQHAPWSIRFRWNTTNIKADATNTLMTLIRITCLP